MKTKFLTLLLVSFYTVIPAQDLFVDSSTYIYSNDDVLFVTDDIRLEDSDSNIYLRGNSQLLQENDVKNSDVGELSVYQEQTTGIFEYNYWASPVGVGIDDVTKANANFDVSNIRNPSTITVSATENFVTTHTPLGTDEVSSFWIYSLISGGGYADWNPVRAAGNIATGYGFTLKGGTTTNNQLDFRGRPNTGTLSISVNFNGTDSDPNSGLDDQVETLTGNPYPSAMDLKLFLSNATNQTVLDGSIYFWEQKVVGTHNLQQYEGGYAIYTPGTIGDLNDNGSYAVATFENYDGYGGLNSTTSGTSTDYNLTTTKRRFSAVGQGFMVRSADAGGAAAGGNAVIDNSMRVYMPENATTGSIFGRQNNSNDSFIPVSHNGIDYESIINNPTIIPEIRFHTKINNTYYRESLLAFRNGTDLSYNKFCDATVPSEIPSDAYFVSDNNNLVIKSIELNEDTRVPFCLKADTNSSIFDVSIYDLVNVPNDLNIYIYDGLTDVYTDLRSGDFSVILDQGNHTNRFEITFLNSNSLGVDDFDAVENLILYHNNSDQELTLLNTNLIELKTIELFDITGKLVLSKHELALQEKHTLSTKNLSTSVYIAKVTTKDNKLITKKIIVN